MKKLLAGLLLCLTIGCGSASSAGHIVIHLLLTETYTAPNVTIQQALGIASYILERDLGIDVVMSAEGVTTGIDINDDPINLAPALKAILEWAARNHRSGGMRVVMPGPLYYFGATLAGGIAEGFCKPDDGLAIAWSNHDPMVTALVIVHEVGHLLGAKHDLHEFPATIMHPDALNALRGKGPDSVNFSIQSSSQVADCLSSLGF